MATPYTTIAAVQNLLGPNYGANPDGTFPDLQQFIDSAHVIVLQVVKCAQNMEPSEPLSDDQLELIERWLSAHLYTKLDPLYTSKSTSGGSGSFVASKDDPERYKEGAMHVDTSGCLKAILNRQVARASWLGKPDSAQIPITQRN